MSDNDENLISQDDIDQLLDASGLDDLDLSSGDKDADMGELTQEDIDNLLKDEPDGLPDVLAEEVDPLPPEDDLDDSLFGNELDSPIDVDGIDAATQPPDNGGADGGELSQDDIDALLNSSVDDPAPTGSDPGSEGEAPEDDSELISQADIDQLLLGSEVPGPGEDENEDDEPISLEDIKGLLAEEEGLEPSSDSMAPGEASAPEGDANPQDAFPQAPAEAVAPDSSADTEALEPVAGDPPSPRSPKGDPLEAEDGAGQSDPLVDLSQEEVDDGIISPEEAVSPEASLLTQEALDTLIKAYDAEESALTPDPDQLLAGLEAEGETDPLAELDVVALDEGSPLENTPEDEEGEVTQEDIDALLMESSDSDEQVEDDEDILISQDDIDTLLMAADQEDEDVLGDLGDDIEDTGLGEDLEPDGLFDQEGGAPEAGEQIILEDGGDEAEAKGRRQWYKSRYLVAALSVFLVLGISIPSAYFIFFSGGEEMSMDVPLALPQEDVGPDDGLLGPVVQVNTAPPVQSQSGTLLLANFVVLAPDKSAEMTFISTDVSIDYSDQRAYHEINKNMSYYRGLIYDAIQKNLTWEKRDEVTQPDLLWEIETTLKKVLPPQYIDSIRFKGFKTS